MGESDWAPIELILWVWGREEWGDGQGRPPCVRPSVPRPGAVDLWAGDASGLAGRPGMAKFGPRRRGPTGTLPEDLWLQYGGCAGWKVFLAWRIAKVRTTR